MGAPELIEYQDDLGNTYKFPIEHRALFEQGMKAQGRTVSPVRSSAGQGGQGGLVPPAGSGQAGGGSADSMGGVEFGPMERDQEAGSGAYDLPWGESDSDLPSTPYVAQGPPYDPEAIDAARTQEELDKMLRGELPHDARMTRRDIDAPLKVQRFSGGESTGRGYLDEASWGFDDEASGVGGMADQAALATGSNGFIDSLLRSWGGADPKADAAAFDIGAPAPERRWADIPPEYGASIPATDARGGQAIDESIPEFDDAGKPNDRRKYLPQRLRTGPVERTTERGYDAPVQGAAEDYAQAFGGARQSYAKESKAAFDEDPLTFTGGMAMAAVPKQFLMRSLGLGPAGTTAREAEEAAARSSDWVSRAAAGATDAFTNPGNIVSSITSGLGHAEGDTWLKRLISAVGGAATEHAIGAAFAPAAELALNIPRNIGRGQLRKLTNPIHNPGEAQTLTTAMNAGANLEAFAKPERPITLANPLPGHPLTSERGIRPSLKYRAVQQALGAQPAGMKSAQPGPEIWAAAADNLTRAAEKQRTTTVNWIAGEKQKIFQSPEGQRVIMTRPLLKGTPRLAHSLIGEHSKNHGGGLWGVNAEQFEKIIQSASDKAREYDLHQQVDAARQWADITRDLRKLREKIYPSIHVIDRQGAALLSKLEANLTQLGISRRASPIDTTPGSEHAQTIYQQTGTFEDSPQTRRAVAELVRYGADPELARQAAGAVATENLIGEAKANKGQARWHLRNLSTKLAPFDPGMRVAGLTNLGLNAQGAIRAPVSTPAKKAAREYMMYLLGMRPPGNTSEEVSADTEE